MKKIFIIYCLLACFQSVKAGDGGDKVSRSFVINSFWDNWYDVVAGAAIGVGSAELTWWLSDKMFGKGSHVAVGSSGNTVDVVYNF